MVVGDGDGGGGGGGGWAGSGIGMGQGFVALFPYFCGERCVNLAVDAPLMTGPALGIWSVLYFFAMIIAVASYFCFEVRTI